MALSVLFSAANIGICIAEIAVHTAKITDSHRLFINDPPPMLSAACAFYSINALFRCKKVYFFVKRHVRIHCWKRRLFNFLIGFWMIRQIAEYGKFAYFIIYEIKLLKLYKTCNIIKKRFITTQKSTLYRQNTTRKMSIF